MMFAIEFSVQRPFLHFLHCLKSKWLWLVLGWSLCIGCGPQETLQVTLLEPKNGELVRGFTSISVQVQPISSLKRMLIAVRYLGKSERTLRKILFREENITQTNTQIDWDTSLEKDGPYQIEVEALQKDGQAILKKSEKIWVVNGTARLQIDACLQQPAIARDSIKLQLNWSDALAELPGTTVELFVQGRSLGTRKTAPYVFDVDVSKYKDGETVSFNAVAVRGVYRGATAVCNVLIDRTGPVVRYVFPTSKSGVVPARFAVSLEVEEEFGVQEVRIRVGDKVVGKLQSPPYQIPVDLSFVKHMSTVTLLAEAVDRAGNVTAQPPQVTVRVDSKPPLVQILKPAKNSQHLDSIQFEVEISDESGLSLIDFYIVDENAKRLDNILHVQSPKKKEIFRASVSRALQLYGAGRRTFEVVARDIRGNVTTRSIDLILGCATDSDCPQQTPPLRCLHHRCLVPRGLGDQCSREAACEPPFVCHFGGLSYCSEQKLGFCRRPCKVDVPCERGYFCRSQQKGPSVCFPGDPCDPASSNCAKGLQCTPWGASSFVCLPTGSRGNGQGCSPYVCSAGQGCIRDYVCIPHGQGSRGVCRRICDTDFPRRDCTTGTRCTSFPLRDKLSNSMGYCL